jgi:hypothetical protein
MTIVLIMLLQALPVYIVAVIFKNRASVVIAAILMGLVAAATGSSAFVLVDLFGIGVACWMGISHVSKAKPSAAIVSQERAPSAEAVREPQQVRSPRAEGSGTTHPGADFLELRRQMLGAAEVEVQEQYATLLAVMYVHLAIETAHQIQGSSNEAREKQDERIRQHLSQGLKVNGLEATEQRVTHTRHVFDLYRDCYRNFKSLLPSSERSLAVVQYKMAMVAAEFLKTQFRATGRASICGFLEVSARAVVPEETRGEPPAPLETTEKKAKILAFKTNEFAFEYACKYLVCRRELLVPVLGIVLAVNAGNGPCVKIANKTDPTIPDSNYAELLETADTTFVCFLTEVEEGVPSIQRGDLVIFVPRLIAADGWLQVGTIVQKVERVFDSERGVFTRAHA